MPFSHTIYSFAAVLALSSVSRVTPTTTTTITRRVSSIAPRPPSSPLPAADFSVPITASAPRSKAKKSLLRALRESQAAQAGSNFTTVLAGSDFDEEYLTNVMFGEQEFMLIVDTGSSDTWAPQVGYACFNLDNPVAQSQCSAPQQPGLVAPQSNRSSGHPQARRLSRSAPNSHRHAIYIDNDVSANNLAPPRPDNITTNEADLTNDFGSDTAPSSSSAMNNVVAPPHPERVSVPSSSPAAASDTFSSEGKKGEAQVSMPVPEFSTILKPVNDSKPAYVMTLCSENVTPESNQEFSPQSQSKPAYVTTLSENVIAKSNQESSPQSTPLVATTSDLNTVSEGKSTIVIDAASDNSLVSESEQDNSTQDSSTAESSTSEFTFSDPSTVSRNISSSNNAQPLVFSITYNHTHHHHHHHVHNHYHAA
ncbi:hypothetical protein F5876DRAFT_65601 [Lentinula aff. lateritia]|uniref:Uncharacterized protein n=1 Tax=Lentinula aff. lateritia TaxID=2804960 RepID=A0ACC1U098_9AGAR|nr:hypothetical protein F5876DRAFT_65601 [Lentinula aff. lateritia]